MKLFEDLWNAVKKRPSNPRAGYNTTDYDPYGHYNHNAEARKQNHDAFDGGEEDSIKEVR